MKRCLALSCLLFISAAVANQNKPNPLTPKEVEEGWILLFDGDTDMGWKIDGEGKVENGELVLGGSKATSAAPTSRFGDYVLTVDKIAITGGAIKFGDTTVEPGALSGKLTIEHKAGGKNGFPIQVSAGSVARLQGIKLKPLGEHSLFNGKDLAGWKRFEAIPARAKSQFTVEDGTIHLKDGPGDLQTEQQFDNFILQIECRTNGPHLNSGVFFRCIPGLYQQGYEAQIHNSFTPQPAREYTIEDYDSKTNELKNKTKVKYTATDFGTGAIYRRVPARGPVANDREWFTMTVAADGKHLATWVNGIQQTDWVDNRPLKDNARNGCKLEKGAISLQGHDKTTDLSFRNIRIADLGNGK